MNTLIYKVYLCFEKKTGKYICSEMTLEDLKEDDGKYINILTDKKSLNFQVKGNIIVKENNEFIENYKIIDLEEEQ